MSRTGSFLTVAMMALGSIAQGAPGRPSGLPQVDCRDEMPRRILSCQDGYYDNSIKGLLLVEKEVKNQGIINR